MEKSKKVTVWSNGPVRHPILGYPIDGEKKVLMDKGIKRLIQQGDLVTKKPVTKKESK